MRLPRLTNNSIATRLFLTAAASSFLVLLIASLFFTTFYRRETEEVFERRLEVYLRAIVAEVAQSGEEGSTDPGRLGEPQFELPGSGWYWQITRMDGMTLEIKASRSLFTNRLPQLADHGVAAEVGGFRRGFVEDPDGRRLRIIERVIDVGDSGVYLVQVAASVEEMEQQGRVKCAFDPGGRYNPGKVFPNLARCAGFSSSPGVLRNITAAYWLRSPSKTDVLLAQVKLKSCSLPRCSRLSRAIGIYS